MGDKRKKLFGEYKKRGDSVDINEIELAEKY